MQKNLINKLHISLMFILTLSCVTSPLIPPKPISQELKKANILFLKENYKEAIPLYQKFLQTNPPSFYQAEALFRIAQCYKTLANFNKAEIFFNRALDISNHPDQKALIHNYLGDLYKDHFDFSLAKENYQKALQYTSFTPWIKRDFLLYKLSIVSIRNSQWEEGFHYLNLILSNHPNSNCARYAYTIVNNFKNKKMFHIRFGVFSNLDNAKKLQQNLFDKDIKTIIDKYIDLNNSIKYAVYLDEKFNNWFQAYEKTLKFKKNNVNSIVVP